MKDGETTFQESIYNLIPKEIVAPPKPPLHKSKYAKPAGKTAKGPGAVAAERPQLGGAASSFGNDLSGGGGPKKVGRTKPVGFMGPATVKADINPKNFLKKKSSNALPPPQKFSYSGPRKPAIVGRGEKPVMGLTTSKNFVVANAVENILAQPKKRPVDPVDYTKKQDFGKVPEYLNQVKAEIQEEYAYIESLTQQAGPGGLGGPAAPVSAPMRELPEAEKKELLAGLQSKWDKTNEAYQKLSFVCDTDGRRARKEALESTLSAIEADIERLNRQHVYVLQDQ